MTNLLLERNPSEERFLNFMSPASHKDYLRVL